MTLPLSVSPKSLLLAAAIAGGLAVLPALAQMGPQPVSQQTAPPAQRDPLWIAASALNAQRDRFYRTRDLDSLAGLYTRDATYVELLPVLSSMQGQPAIKIHFQELFDANVSRIDTSVGQVMEDGPDTAIVTGDYSLVTKDRAILGHFVQVLHRESGSWKIAEHIFARPELVTESELRDGDTD
jgi:ketosteroid isomerase-like protein